MDLISRIDEINSLIPKFTLNILKDLDVSNSSSEL